MENRHQLSLNIDDRLFHLKLQWFRIQLAKLTNAQEDDKDVRHAIVGIHAG